MSNGLPAGYRFWAPAGTATPTALAKDSRFNDTWPLAWIPVHSTAASLLHVTSYERADRDGVIAVINRGLAPWHSIGLPEDASTIACMVGWESPDSRVRVFGQGAVQMDALDAALTGLIRR